MERLDDGDPEGLVSVVDGRREERKPIVDVPHVDRVSSQEREHVSVGRPAPRRLHGGLEPANPPFYRAVVRLVAVDRVTGCGQQVPLKREGRPFAAPEHVVVVE